MSNLTVVILTKNEELNIVEVIANARLVTDKILVVDSGSTDNTVKLAESNGARVVYRAWDNDFAAQRNFALKHVDTEWVLYLDADERMNEELVDEIICAIRSCSVKKYRFLRRNSAFGREFKYGVLSPNFVVRLFPKDKVVWCNKVHETPVCELPMCTLNGTLKHNTYEDFEQYINKMNLYAIIGAKKYREQNKKASIIKDVLFRPYLAFLKMYILKRGFLEGWLGFVLSVCYANYTLNKYIRLIDLQKEGK